MHSLWIRSSALSILAAALAMAQNSGTPPAPPTPAQLAARRVSRLTSQLSLTSSQQETAATIFTQEETTLASIHTSLQQDETALQAAIEANDPAAMQAQATAIGSLQGQAILARAQADAALYQILTADQQTTFKQFLQHGFGHGPGNRPPPPPPPPGL